MASKLKQLQDRQAALNKALRKSGDEFPDPLSASASDEDRAAAKAKREELQAKYDALKVELDEVKTALAREQELQEIERDLIPAGEPPGPNGSGGSATPIEGNSAPNATPAWVKDPKKGFERPADFLSGVLNAARTGRLEDPRLKYQAAVGSDEGSTFADPYGGFLLPSGFSPNLLSVPSEADPVAGMTTKVPMETAVLDIPARVDKTHTSSVSGGLRVYRRAEGDTPADSRMEFEQVKLTATSLFGVSYATEELLARSPSSFIALLEAGFADEFGAKQLSERLEGTGVGMFEGVNNSPCMISQAAESGQAAATIVLENIVNMRSRCWRYGGAVWLANHDTLPQLMTLVITVGTAGVPVWQPSAREDAPDLVLGRPLFLTEFCETIGTAGDIVLGNWSQYLEGTLSGPQQAESIHVRFINHERTFKFWLENDGRCWWRTALTPRKSSTTLSPFVRLATRS